MEMLSCVMPSSETPYLPEGQLKLMWRSGPSFRLAVIYLARAFSTICLSFFSSKSHLFLVLAPFIQLRPT